jgi:hypothetical protein
LHGDDFVEVDNPDSVIEIPASVDAELSREFG